MRIFGSDAYAHLPKDHLQHSKLSDRAHKYKFIGFTEGIKAYKLYDPVTHRVVYSRSVTFDEHKLLTSSSLVEDPPESGEGDNISVIAGTEADSDSDTQETEQVETGERNSPGEMGERNSPGETGERNPPDCEPSRHDLDDNTTETELPHQTVEHDVNDSESASEANDTNASEESQLGNQPPTRTLRSRETIRPPISYSPSSWTSSRARTDWNTQQPVIDKTPSQQNFEPVRDSGKIEDTNPENLEQLMWLTSELSKPQVQALAAAVQNLGDPLTMEEAYTSSDAAKWRAATNEEYQSLIKNGTWSLTDLPPGRQPITNKWIFKTKYDQDGKVSRHKARLVVHGFSQVYGQDYTETFAPVAKFTTMRIVLAIAAQENFHLQQLDVKMAFLNGEIDEDIYMIQPQGYIKPGQESKVCKLHKGIYGLKQSGRKWFERFEKSLKKLGFAKSSSDPSLYIHTRGTSSVILLVYVDDILMASNSEHLLRVIKQLLTSEFEMTEMGEPSYLLGVQIKRDKIKGILTLNQAKYVEDMLVKFKMQDAHPSSTPLTSGIKLERPDNDLTLSKAEKTELAAIPYREAVGTLIYLTCLTRPDLAFPVHMVSQFMSSYRTDHWGQVKKIFRYVKGTKHYGLTYRRTQKPKQLEGYTDSDWGSDPVTRKSVAAYLFLLAEGPISWLCKKNQSVCLSSTESEYKALTLACKEAVWCRRCLDDLGKQQQEPTVIYCDNSGATALTNNPVFHARTKHIAVHHHFIRDMVAENQVRVYYISTKRNLADVLTKGLPSEVLKSHCGSMGLNSQVAVNKDTTHSRDEELQSRSKGEVSKT